MAAPRRSQSGGLGKHAGRSIKRTMQRRNDYPVEDCWQRRASWVATRSHLGGAWYRGGQGCAYRSIVITQIGPSRSPGSVDRDHRDRHRDHADRSIVITPAGPGVGHPLSGGWPEHSGAGQSDGAIRPRKGPMATERLSMRQIREILRQKWCLGRSHRAVAESLGIGSGTVGTTVLRARAAGLDWAQVEAPDRRGPRGPRVRAPDAAQPPPAVVPDCAYLHAERRKPGVTLELLHLEYLEQHPDGYRYTQFCEFYRRWLQAARALDAPGPPGRREVLRRLRRARSRAIIDPATGEVIEVELFVAVLGASNYTYAEATLTQQVPDWIASHQRAFEYLRRASPPPSCPTSSRAASPSRAATSRACRRTYEELARHYGTVVLPARPGKPATRPRSGRRCRSPTRWILARLRHETLLLPRRAQRAHRRAARRPEHAPDAPVPRQPPGALRAPGSPRAAAPAGRGRSSRRVEATTPASTSTTTSSSTGTTTPSPTPSSTSTSMPA